MSTRGTLKTGQGSLAMQPFQLCSCSSSGCAAMAEEAMQPWRLSNLQQHRLKQPCSLAALAINLAVVQLKSTALQPCSFNQRPCSCAGSSNSLAVLQLCSPINGLASVSDCESLKSRMLSWLVRPPGTSDVCANDSIVDVRMPISQL